MARLILPDDVLKQAGLSNQFGNFDRLSGPLASAELQLRRWVTDAVLDAVIADELDEPLKTGALKLACVYLTLYYATPVFFVPTRSNGVLLRESSETAFTQDFYSPKEIAELRKMYWDTAAEAIKPYQQTAVGGVFAGGIRHSAKDAQREDTDLLHGTFRRDLFDETGAADDPQIDRTL